MLKNTVKETALLEDYTTINALSDKSRYFAYNNSVNTDIDSVASHVVIDRYIENNGKDYRTEDKPNPCVELQNREVDNVCLARCKDGVKVK